MQRTETIRDSDLSQVIEAFFQEYAIAFEHGASTYGAPPQEYSDAGAVRDYVRSVFERGYKLALVSVYYPAANGRLWRKETTVDPARFNGANIRHEVAGWGMIQIIIRNGSDPMIEVEISVNSAKRAENWANNIAEMGPADAWDWKIVERNARRAIRALRKCAVTA
ncbi:MAG: hypothetical protein AAF667_14730 [Pseudomonadota bacterium]